MALFHYSSIFHLLVNSLVTSSNLSRTWKIPSSSSVSEPLHSFSLATEAFGTGCTITGTSATVSNKQESSSLLKKIKSSKSIFLYLTQNYLKQVNNENRGVPVRLQMLGLVPWRSRFICHWNRLF